MMIEMRCAECGRMFTTTWTQGQIYCSVGCQLAKDTLEDSIDDFRQALRARPAKVARAERVPVTLAELWEQTEKKLDVSATELSERIGVSRATGFNWKRGKGPTQAAEAILKMVKTLADEES
jgi:DNA-binding transcriptional regulator YiaG